MDPEKPKKKKGIDAAAVLRGGVLGGAADAVHTAGEKLESIRGNDGGDVEGI